MKNIRTNIIFTIIIIAISYNYISAKPAGVGMVEAADKVLDKQLPILKKIMEIISSKGVDASKALGAEAASVLAKGVADASKAFGVDAAGELEKAIADSADKFSSVGQGMVAVAGVGVAIYGITQLYPIGKEVATYICPSEEQKILNAERLEAAQCRLDLLRAEKSFRQCLVSNRLNPKRGFSGLPSDCEDVAEAFASMGGFNEVKQAMEFFNTFRK
ncbi:hypothetical protein HYV10_00095 [Candidatus Dependentiae bacterium]|nr:hypothetical protein [Candidatus Dependentiae bacterium]